MNYMGDFNPGQVVMIYFNTFTSDDPSASATMTNFINTDVHIHKDDSLTQRNNAAGITVDVDVDGITGTHFIKIDTADNTVADFYSAGHDYFVRIEGTTVDAATINAVVGSFSIANRQSSGFLQGADIATLASQTSFTLDQGSADNDAYNGCTIVITDQTTAVQKAPGLISDYVGATKTVTLHEDPGIFTMAAGDNVQIFATAALANVRSFKNQLAVVPSGGHPEVDIARLSGSTQRMADLTEIARRFIANSATPLTDYVADNSILAQMLAVSGTTGDYSDATDSLEAISGLIAALNDISTADVNAQVVDALNVDTYAELAADPGATPTLTEILMLLYEEMTHKITQTATQKKLYKADGTTVLLTFSVSDDATTATRGAGS
jgi:hypothetical protein